MSETGTPARTLQDRVRIREAALLSDYWGKLTRYRFDLRRSDGQWQEQTREVYDRGHGAVLLAYDLERRHVLLTRQFRLPAFVAGYREEMIEAPAGLLDKLDPETRIRAEVEEETGYRLGKVERLFAPFMSPGSVTEQVTFFIAPYSPDDRVSDGGGLEEEGEDIEVLDLAFDEAFAMVRDGRICDGKTILLLDHLALTVFRD
ncbi:NUDIX domain-containing protein [Pannonibacter indicus]|uniref:GDP-mannose pyrophosphatase n=1 Tax=Pannonibacter indicus TaxID=466044 RepID=A0A0K6I4J3_9HYPH|nr:NUDIX domain-containing protein [Pannonibacter indicus]CUA98069.1 nudix-type nucleoside diphosphatase, YffH/AdpP family [Pannonibacter indicus]